MAHPDSGILLLFSNSVVSDSLQPHRLQHARHPCSSLSHGICSDRLLSGMLQFTHNFELYDWCIIIDKFLQDYIKQKNPNIKSILFLVQFSHSVVSDSLWPHGLQHGQASLSITAPGVHSDWCSLSQWCHSTISSCVIPFSSRLQSFPASGSFPVSQFFASGGQSFGVSASTSVLPMNIQDWFPLGYTGWISLQSKELSRVFSNTTVSKHQLFCTQLSL